MPFPGYKPVHEDFLTKIVEVNWPDDEEGPAPNIVEFTFTIVSIATLEGIGMGEGGTGPYFGTHGHLGSSSVESCLLIFRRKLGFPLQRGITATGFVVIDNTFEHFIPVDPPGETSLTVIGIGSTSANVTCIDTVYGGISITGTATYGTFIIEAVVPGHVLFPFTGHQAEVTYTCDRILAFRPMTLLGEPYPGGQLVDVQYSGRVTFDPLADE